MGASLLNRLFQSFAVDVALCLMNVRLDFLHNVLLEVVEDVLFTLIQRIQMPEVELHLIQLPVDVVAVGANVEQLEMRPTDVVWHQNQRVLAENAQKVFVGVAVLFNITVVY